MGVCMEREKQKGEKMDGERVNGESSCLPVSVRAGVTSPSRVFLSLFILSQKLSYTKKA